MNGIFWAPGMDRLLTTEQCRQLHPPSINIREMSNEGIPPLPQRLLAIADISCDLRVCALSLSLSLSLSLFPFLSLFSYSHTYLRKTVSLDMQMPFQLLLFSLLISMHTYRYTHTPVYIVITWVFDTTHVFTHAGIIGVLEACHHY